MASYGFRRNPFLTIPFQSFEIENTYLLTPKYDSKARIYSQLCYKDSSVEIQDIPILTPPLKIHHYDIRKSLLFLEIDTHHPFYQKFHSFQEFIIQTFYNHQSILLPHLIDDTVQLSETSNEIKVGLSNQSVMSQPKHLSLSKIRSLFQFPLKDNYFTIYIHPNTLIHTAGSQKPVQAFQLIAGTYIRALLRFYNITTIKSAMQKNYLRIQHSVPAIWYIGAPRIMKRPTATTTTTTTTTALLQNNYVQQYTNYNYNQSYSQSHSHSQYPRLSHSEHCLIIV